MSVTFGFYNSKNGDRVYDATQMSSLFSGIIRDGVFANYPAQNQHLTVSAGPAVSGHPTVDIGPGRAWFNGTWTDNSSTLSLQLAAADNVQDRYDAIVLEVNTTNNADNTVSPAVPGRSNGFVVVAGTPGGNYPTVSSSDGIYRYVLAYVKVAHGASTVSSLDYKVGTTVPYIVNAVQETWSATDLINNWNSQWAAYLSSLDGNFATYLSGKDAAWNTYLSGKDSAWTAYLGALDAAIPTKVSQEMGKIARVWLVDKDISSVANAMQTFARDSQQYPVPLNAPNFYPNFFDSVTTVGAYPPQVDDVVVGKNGYYGTVTTFTGYANNYSMTVKSVGKKIYEIPNQNQDYWVTFSGIDPYGLEQDDPICDRTLQEVNDAFLDGKNIKVRIEYWTQEQLSGQGYDVEDYYYPQYNLHTDRLHNSGNRYSLKGVSCILINFEDQNASRRFISYALTSSGTSGSAFDITGQ